MHGVISKSYQIKFCSSLLFYYSSTSKSTLAGFSHDVSWHGPQADVHGSPYPRQLQRLVLHAVVQLQWIIFSSSSGATFTSAIMGTNFLSSSFQP